MIVKLTKVLLPTRLTSTVLLIAKLYGTAFTVAFALTTVSFSLEVTLTILVKLPSLTIFIVILNTYDSLGLINEIVNSPVSLS